MIEPFIGTIMMFGGNFAPRGWAFCNGQLLPISQNTALFSLLGITYGGDGRSTFALPNLQGRVPMHPEQGPGLTLRGLGEQGGASTVTLTEAQIPQHAHQLKHGSAVVPQGNPLNALPSETSGRRGGELYAAPAVGELMHRDVLSTAGGGQAHSNMSPYLGINFVIALYGVYPSRS
ncbi:tail fiber protein [Paenibacillus sp. J5C_2022]|uniref:phage tail protein n=1 Tax=Paenibacillus sp. J5C2022 TaxID=2977129 RepID=UPI0021D2D5C9|nr:tail fiber protein [Paenibacillus sp. J5C2022]MCU6708644.1 tail fiber protein [Paenibacillus sp. J5C2022]